MAEQQKIEQRAKGDVKPAVAEADGLLQSLLVQSSQIAETAVGATFSTIRDVKGEVQKLAVGTLDLVNGFQQGATRIARQVTDRFDRLTDDAIGTSESLALSAIRVTRDAAVGATQLAGRLGDATVARDVARA
jgi:hypothetical protein